MSCLNPLVATLPREGAEDKRPRIRRDLERMWKYKNTTNLPKNHTYYADTGEVVETTFLPCRRCLSCLQKRARDWATRVTHEASLYESNMFLTLTYSNKNLPDNGSLCKRDVQLFFKKLRYYYPKQKLRYLYSGEYGDIKKTFRPHYHIALFNLDMDDKRYWKTVNKNAYYTSDVLEDIWSKGRIVIGDLSYESAAYIARYTYKKQFGEKAFQHYQRYDYLAQKIVSLTPEYSQSSTGGKDDGGIGFGWYQKFKTDLYPSDTCVMNGFVSKPPEYYDRLLQREDPDMYNYVKARRMAEMPEVSDLQFRRLEAKALVMKQRSTRLLRILDDGY